MDKERETKLPNSRKQIVQRPRHVTGQMLENNELVSVCSRMTGGYLTY